MFWPVIWACFAVAVVNGDVSVEIDDRFQFVLEADGEELVGVDVLSPSDSLVPGEKAASGPFEFALSQRRGQVTFANLGSKVKLDGSFPLPARWNPSGVPDATWSHAVGATPIGPFPIFETMEARPHPDVQLRLDEENRFTLTGTGQDLIGLSIQSPSGSLIPGALGDAGPWSLAYSNDARLISYGALGNDDAFHVNGTITLPVSWNPVGLDDVTFHYNQSGPIHSGTISVPIERPDIDRLGVSLDDDFRFVLTGDGQQVNSVQFDSGNNVLLPASVPAPFDRIEANSKGMIRFASDDPVAINGNVALDARWNRNLGYRDVEFGYEQNGFALPSSPLPGGTYPIDPIIEPVTASVDGQTLQLVISGIGQEVRSVQFSSPLGSLRHDGESTGPFETTVSSRSSRVVLESSEFVTVDGSISLPVSSRDNPTRQDIQFRYSQVGVVGTQGPFSVVYPPSLTPIRVSIDVGGNVVIQGAGHDVEWVELSSVSGALIPSQDVGPFESFESNTPNHVKIQGSLTLDGLVALATAWDEIVGADIEFSYKLADVETVFGPISPRYPPLNLVSVIVNPAITDTVQLFGNGQLISAVELKSPSGSLVVQEDPNFGPFDIVEEYSAEHVKLLSSEPIRLGSLEIPLEWDSSGEADIQVEIAQVAGTRAVFTDVLYSSPVVPEPAGAVSVFLGALVLMAQRQRRTLRNACQKT